MKQFAVFDIDGTLVRWQMYHAIVDALAREGRLTEQTYISVRKARMQWKKRADDDAFKMYEQQLVTAYELVLTSISYEHFNRAVDTVFEEYKDQVYTYTRQLISKLKAEGYLLFAVSGSQTEIVAKIAQYWGFDDFAGTTYEVVNGQFTGKVTSHLAKKHVAVAELARKHAASYGGSMAVGDSEGDITMLETVERPIAFNPSRQLLVRARQAGWEIVVERKNVVYKLEHTNGQYILA